MVDSVHISTTDETVLIHGGVIRTQNAGYATCEAMVTCGSRIRGVGDKGDMRALAGPGARVIDVGGATGMPGLVDTHSHMLHFAVWGAPLVSLFGARSHDEIVERIRARAQTTAPGEWIMATPVGDGDLDHFKREPERYADLEDGVLPGRERLDRATVDHPVAILAFAPVIPNTASFNSMGLQRVSIDRDTPDRAGNVWIDKDAAGEPTGLIRGSVNCYYAEDAFNDQIWRNVPCFAAVNQLDVLRAAMPQTSARGVTTSFENHMLTPAFVDLYRTLRQRRELGLRVMAAMELEDYGLPISRTRSKDEIRLLLEQARQAIDLDDEFFRFSGVSVMWDGICNSGWMRMKKPYPGPYGELTEGHYQTSPEKIELAMAYCLENEMRLNTSALGNRAVEENLDMTERLMRETGKDPIDWVLVHAFFFEPEMIKRYAALHFNHTTTMTAPWGKGDMYMRRFGEPVLSHLCLLRTIFDVGMCIGGGTDWAPRSPWKHIELSLTHEFFESGRRNLGPDQQITRDETLSIFTNSAAGTMAWPEIGTLAEGNYADYIILDRDPGACPLDAIEGTQVLRTVLAGSTVHDSGAM